MAPTMIQAARKRRNRKTGRIAITFEVDEQTWLNMRERAIEGMHFGTLDFVVGTLNMAFLDCFPRSGEGPTEWEVMQEPLADADEDDEDEDEDEDDKGGTL